jgi:hypothetical protein
MKLDFFSDINKENYSLLKYDEVDSWLIKFNWANALFLIIYSWLIYYLAPARYYPNPFSWRVVTVPEVVIVSTLALLTALAISLLRGRFQNHYLYRFLMTNALMMYSYLVVFISGGSIEWHFHFFVMLAALTLYADWRLGWWAVIAVALHHGILNLVAPEWVYFYGRNDVAFLTHAIIVLIMAIVITKLSENMRKLVGARNE